METSVHRRQDLPIQRRVARPNAVLLLAMFGLLFAGGLYAQEARRVAAASGQQTTPQPTNGGFQAIIAEPPQQPASPSPIGMDALDSKHKLAIGDQISIRILEDEDEPKLLSVTDSGEIEAPYIGRRLAEGKTCKELAQALKAELEQQYYFQATVIISVDLMAKSRGKVYLVGPIRVPGPQDIPSDESFTLSKAILRAGGFTDFANTHRVKVTRHSKIPGGADETFTVDVANILENGKSEADLILEPGDLIYVPERLIRF